MRCGTDQRLSAYIDGELSTEQAAKVSEHLNKCAECATVVDQIQQIKRAATRLQDHEPPADLLHRSLDAMERTPAPGWSWLLIAAGSAAAATSLAGVLLILNARSDDQGPSSTRASAPAATPSTHAGSQSAVTTAQGPAQRDGGAAGQPDAQVAPQGDRKLAATKGPRQRSKRSPLGSPGVEGRYRRTVAELRALADQQSRRWSPGERQRYVRACKVFDQAIRDGRAAAALTASDPRAQDVLLDTYRQEIRFLQQSILKGALPDSSTGQPDFPALPATHGQ